MMRLFTAPEFAVDEAPEPSVFLAGGITGCPDWQAEAIGLLSSTGWTVFNPRQVAFDVTNPDAGPQQVEWECAHRRLADWLLFWLPACDASVTTQPIAMYEFGHALARGRRMVVGCDPGYPRRRDVELMLRYDAPSAPQTVHATLADTIAALPEVM